MDYEYYMRQAYNEALKAKEIDEVPIGAVIVYKDEIIAKGYNMRNTLKNSLAHAEIIAINEAAKVVGDWRLEECTMFITLEPCPMCAGAIVQARIPTVVFGARNAKAGCGGSVLNLLQTEGLNHQVEVVEGILENECSSLMTDFFKEFRLKKKDV